MGTVYTATCNTCNYENDFCLGFGMRSINLVSSMSVLSVEEQTEIQEMIDNKTIANFDIENKLTECSNCNELREKTIITITKQNGTTLTYGTKCTQCTNAIHIHENINQVSCPCCKQSTLTFMTTGHWD